VRLPRTSVIGYATRRETPPHSAGRSPICPPAHKYAGQAAHPAGICGSRNGTPASKLAVTACRSVWGVMVFADPSAPGSSADDPPGAVPVQPPPLHGPEHRPLGALADGQVDRPGGPRRQQDGDDLAALAADRQCPVPALQAQELDSGVPHRSGARTCPGRWPRSAPASSRGGSAARPGRPQSGTA